jgi:IS605 OrfB family transposase
MFMGCEGLLTLTVRMKVSPEPEVVEFLKRYRDALNYSVRRIIECKATSISKVHKLLYNELKVKFNFPSRIAIDCYREALSIAKSWLKNPKRGKMPTMKTLKMWLTPLQSYRVKDNYIEIIGGYRLRIIGWDKRYDQYPNKEARLVYRNGEIFLMVVKRIPKPSKYVPRGILAVDVNERNIVLGNDVLEVRYNTVVERALYYKLLAEKLQEKYSFGKYRAWTRRKILKRMKHFHKKAKNIIEDWAKRVSHEIVSLAKEYQYAVAREDLTNLIENLIELPKEHRVRMIVLSYRRFSYWIDWQAEKHGIPIIIVEPRGTSSICPVCNSKLKENGYRRLKCGRCGFEGDRDTVAILNIEIKAIQRMWGALTPLNALQMKHVNPNKCREPPTP